MTSIKRVWGLVVVVLTSAACERPTEPLGPVERSLQPLGAVAAAAPGAYGLTELPSLPGFPVCNATAINNAGKIVGFCGTPPLIHPVIWENGAVRDLGTAGYEPTGINDAGQIIGISMGGGGAAVLWNNGETISLGALSEANGINADGQIVGTIRVGTSGGVHAALWSNGVISDLGLLPGGYADSRANAINVHGEIVGNSFFGPDNRAAAVLWANGSMTDLAPEAPLGNAFDLNDAGQVVGQIGKRASTWQNGVITYLSAPPEAYSWALGVNDAGRIVGYYYLLGSSRHAVLWEGGAMTELPGDDCSRAVGINASGLIVGTCGNSAVLWSPLDVTPPTIAAPPDITTNAATDECSATVDPGSATATDDRGVPSITRAPSGSVFDVGSTAITWTAADAAGNTASALQTVIVRDAQLPSLAAPADVSVGTDPGRPSASVNPGSAAASDNCPGVAVSGSRSDGQLVTAPFPVGVTTITWTATDGSGNKRSAEQQVRVADLEAPMFTVPASLTVDATTPSGAVVVYTAVATDNVGVASFACTPPSGGTFPIGTETVACAAADAAGNTAHAAFRVTVKGAQQQITDFEGEVAGLDLQDGTETSLEQKLDAALRSLGSGQRDAAVGQLQALINQVNAQVGKKITITDAAILIARARQILAVIGG